MFNQNQTTFVETFGILNSTVEYKYEAGARFPAFLALDSDGKLHGFHRQPEFLTEDIFGLETKYKWVCGNTKQNIERSGKILILDFLELNPELKSIFDESLEQFEKFIWKTEDVIHYRIGDKRSWKRFSDYLYASRTHQQELVHHKDMAEYNLVAQDIRDIKLQLENFLPLRGLIGMRNLSPEQQEVELRLYDEREKELLDELRELEIRLDEISAEKSNRFDSQLQENKPARLMELHEKGVASKSELTTMLSNHYGIPEEEIDIDEVIKTYRSQEIVLIQRKEKSV